MDKQYKYKKVILLELDEDLAEWLKLVMNNYLGRNHHIIGKQNAQLLIDKIIQAKKEKGKTVRLTNSLGDYE